MPKSSFTSAYLRYFVAFLALTCGLYFSVAHSDRGWLVTVPNSLFANPPTDGDDYDLQALEILNRALLQVKDNYVEPERIDPELMLAYALNAIQEEIPQVVARFDTDIDDHPTTVELQVDEMRESFDLEIGTLWEMSFRLREIFRFVQENLDDEDLDLRLVEYAAINGMLDTLDPHSVLLSPEVFAEMQSNNRGSFGGLGIVISIRDGQLTIISPIHDTPAHRAGLRSGDRILKIGEESTINMSIEEAVSRLRGDPGTAVEIDVMREGWQVAHQFTIVREIISIESVESQVLGDGIGYISISNFQGNTHDDLVAHLGRLREEMGEIQGLVLDLRDNPGGLLEQAIRVTDTFLDDGTIVTTVGEGHRLREEKKATEEGTEPFYPIVVLVNPGSASASEIVAGALQNHGRAVLVGDRTFGKGSVQVLYEFQDGSALKLTIAQYLTPGDISIQSVGIVPHIRVVPMEISQDHVDLFPGEHVVREGDLSAHLDSEHAAEISTSLYQVRYYREPEEERDPDAIIEDTFETDFEIDFAQRLLVAAGEVWRADEMLATTTEVREQMAEEQIQLVSARLTEVGVDWTAGNGDASDIELTVSTEWPDNVVPAGESLNLTVTATNHGDELTHRLWAVTDADLRIFSDLEFPFGQIGPDESRTWTVPIEVREDEPTRMDRVVFHLRQDEADSEHMYTADLVVQGSERPHFGIAYQIIDDEAGNGDGLLQLGERVTFRLTVTNVGPGRGSEVLVYLKNEVEAAILLEHGRETWEAGLDSGISQAVDFQFQVQHAPDDNMIRLEAAVYDTVFREFTSTQVEIPLHPDGDLFSPAPGAVSLVSEANIRNAAHDDGNIIAVGPEGLILTQLGTLGDWVRVVTAGDDYGWVSVSDSEPVTGSVIASTVDPQVTQQPPMVVLDRSTLWTDSSALQLSGYLQDDVEVADYYIWVSGEENDQHRRVKVCYVGLDGEIRADIDQEVELFTGHNRITVIARDNEHMTSSDVVFVYRRSEGEQLSVGPTLE